MKDHAKDARHLGKGVIERDVETLIPNKEEAILLYCGGGYRSILAADALQQMGYRNVVSMDGGINGWRDAGYPIERWWNLREDQRPSGLDYECRYTCLGWLLAIDSIELFDHLVGLIDGVFIVDHNLDRLFAALIDDEGKSAFFRHGFCGRRNPLHVIIN